MDHKTWPRCGFGCFYVWSQSSFIIKDQGKVLRYNLRMSLLAWLLVTINYFSMFCFSAPEMPIKRKDKCVWTVRLMTKCLIYLMIADIVLLWCCFLSVIPRFSLPWPREAGYWQGIWNCLLSVNCWRSGWEMWIYEDRSTHCTSFVTILLIAPKSL